MTISQVSTLSTSPLCFLPPLHFPVFSSSLTDIHYKYTLWLYIAFGSAKYWLIYALAERNGMRLEFNNFDVDFTGLGFVDNFWCSIDLNSLSNHLHFNLFVGL
jgi:hypothetical protein